MPARGTIPWQIESSACEGWLHKSWHEALQVPAVKVAATSPAAIDSLQQIRIVEAGQIAADELESLERWVRDGGIALISGVQDPDLSWCGQGELAPADDLLAFAGMRARRHDPGLIEVRPALLVASDLLFPLRPGDGLRLGRRGLGHALDLEAVDAEVLAQAYRDRMESDLRAELVDHPSVAVRALGSGFVYFTSFSLARVAYCYPDRQGRASDCSAAASAQTLMRLMLSNMLWRHHQLAWPVARQGPGSFATVVAITGDVHADPAGLQIKSARRLAEVAAQWHLPVSFYVVGEVATRFPADYAALQSMPNVEIGTHSSRGQQYRLGHSRIPFRRRGGVHGPAAVYEDVRAAERLLGLDQGSPERNGWRSIRTEAWGSNEQESGAWTGMQQAGIALVLDHQIDLINSHPAVTPPRAWLAGSARERLSLPAFTRHVHTATDDFRAPERGLPLMFSLPAAQPDPCCNRALRFQDYLPYVQDWHDALTDIGQVLGTTQVWLWHPSTPTLHGAFDELGQALEAMAADPRVRFARAHELATWNRNRHLGRLELELDGERRIVAMAWQPNGDEPLAPLPAKAHPDAGTVSFWVFGALELPGWHSQTITVEGRALTILSQALFQP